MPSTQEYIVAVTIATETADLHARRNDRHRWDTKDREIAERELERMLASTKPVQYQTPYN